MECSVQACTKNAEVAFKCSHKFKACTQHMITHYQVCDKKPISIYEFLQEIALNESSLQSVLCQAKKNLLLTLNEMHNFLRKTAQKALLELENRAIEAKKKIENMHSFQETQLFTKTLIEFPVSDIRVNNLKSCIESLFSLIPPNYNEKTINAMLEEILSLKQELKRRLQKPGPVIPPADYFSWKNDKQKEWFNEQKFEQDFIEDIKKVEFTRNNAYAYVCKKNKGYKSKSNKNCKFYISE
ncbi:hypothetical protein SteCoe_1473 [Stentor coeruleus]|uniref:Uncharacterized protein n=1 Tax=Stentor coeruleus TaxID=5963 RepID=A0A1R2D1W3_9CILI|nr:hypothetical protein SteCoe_1473 [Stentor coeruleus]